MSKSFPAHQDCAGNLGKTNHSNSDFLTFLHPLRGFSGLCLRSQAFSIQIFQFTVWGQAATTGQKSIQHLNLPKSREPWRIYFPLRAPPWSQCKQTRATVTLHIQSHTKHLKAKDNLNLLDQFCLSWHLSLKNKIESTFHLTIQNCTTEENRGKTTEKGDRRASFFLQSEGCAHKHTTSILSLRSTRKLRPWGEQC